MRAGDRDRRIRLQERQLTQGPSGEEVESWISLGLLWAGKRDMRADERWAANQLVAEISTVWTVNWFPAWETIGPDTHRLVYRDRIYEIHGLREIGRHEGIEIATAARAEASYALHE